MSYNPAFMGVPNIGSVLILNELENNYKSFLDHGFLSLGGFTNVNIPTTNISNFDLHILKPTTDKNTASNTVWQAPRKDWIYETNTAYSGLSPINISGVYVNSNFYPGPTGNATLGYKINYPEGKIIFNSGLSPSSVVQLEYSFRSVQVYKMEEFPYWKEIQHRSLENKTGFAFTDKGTFSINPENRVQLPAVVIESIAASNNKPFRLGDKSLIIEQDMLLHVLADNPKEKNNIVDILRLQEDRFIWLYNTNNVVKSGVYPLNYDGSKNTNSLSYFEIVNNPNYQWIKCRISDVSISDMNFVNIRMYGSVVRITNEIIYTNFDCNPCSTISLPSAPINLELELV
jgi:hypothetical protein